MAGSWARARTASAAMRPPTSADRSRPPTPITCVTPSPQRSSRLIASCAPVPAAATTPTRPGRTTLAKPSPTPPSTAVPAPGPHHQVAERAAVLLELDLGGERHVVAEQQHVEAGPERLVRLERGESARARR